jgi:type IV pilus biogenesis protein CpaD/CtpE
MNVRALLLVLVAALLSGGCAEPDDAEVAAAAAEINAGTPPEKVLFEAGLDTAALVRATRRILDDPARLRAFLEILRRETE